MLYKCQNKWDSTTENINIAPSSDICVCLCVFFTYNGSPLFMEGLVGLFFLFFFLKALAATGMHWNSAERTAPLNAPSLTGSTKQSLKERGGGRGDV